MQSHLKLFISFLVFVSFCSPQLLAQKDTTMRDITAMEIADEMAPGINLFNTLDATATWTSGLAIETAWGQPYTTFEMVESMANRGFKTLRIPVSWHNHMGDGPGYKIDKAWMDRVETVANYALDNGMYAIIDVHHDDEFFQPTYAKKDAGIAWLEAIWTQIATRFKNYGDHLIFETMNEPRELNVAHEWSDGLPENREVINAFVKTAVATIRASGGNNARRMVMIQQYGASPTPAKESLEYPEGDTCLMVSVHNYGPYNFCLNDNGTARWGTSAEKNAIRNEIKSYADNFEAKGIPVIIGEWGAKHKGNYGDRVMYYDNFARACKQNGVTPLLWMFNFDRKKLVWELPLIEEAITQAYDSSAVYANKITLNLNRDTLYVGETLQLLATIDPDTASTKVLAWTSFDALIADVDQRGLVRAKASGITNITATTIGITSTCQLLVLDTVKNYNFHVEAENFSDQNGIQSEACSDVDGGENIGYIQNEDWGEYVVKVDSTGVYRFTARVASGTQGGSIELRANHVYKGSVVVDPSKTNGWQNWYTTEATEVVLYKGINTIKLTFKGGGGYLYNLNWFNISLKTDGGTPVADVKRNVLKVFPNPAREQLHIELMDKPSRVEIYNLNGSLVMADNITLSKHSMDVSQLHNGVYILRVHADGFSTKQKVIIQ